MQGVASGAMPGASRRRDQGKPVRRITEQVSAGAAVGPLRNQVACTWEMASGQGTGVFVH